jgi:signal-transduction protein with cAMP-binding, CBS, and nucleotidyltransferase domain
MFLSKTEINKQLTAYREQFSFTGIPFDVHRRIAYITSNSLLDDSDLDWELIAVAHVPSASGSKDRILFNIMTGFMMNAGINDIPMLEKIEGFSIQIRVKLLQGTDVMTCIAIDETSLINALKKTLNALDDYINKHSANNDNSPINIEDSLESFGGTDITSQY